jgi:transcriptional regulator
MGTKQAFTSSDAGSLEILPGTLDLLILKAVARGPLHGYAIMKVIKERSADVLNVAESSLYPALQRLLLNRWVKAEWGVSENNRRARFYTLTAAGHKQLADESESMERMMAAIQGVLRTA